MNVLLMYCLSVPHYYFIMNKYIANVNSHIYKEKRYYEILRANKDICPNDILKTTPEKNRSQNTYSISVQKRLISIKKEKFNLFQMKKKNET